MDRAASRLCGDSTPIFSLSDICKRMQFLVACCGSEVHIELRYQTDNHDEENAQEEHLQSDEPSVIETVL